MIVGGRVAGGSLALLLARQGRRVVVVDRDRFPSDTLSTHFVSAFSVPHLERLGVLADLLEAGFRRLVRTRIYVGACHFESPAAPGGGFGLTPRRDVLDALLLDHARAAGAEVLTRTRAQRLLQDADGRVAGVEVDGADGPRELRGRVVVGADGKASKVAAWTKAEAYEALPALRPAYYGYFHGLEPLPETALELFFCDDAIGFLFPMRPGEDCLALELQPADWERFRSDPAGAFVERYEGLPGMRSRLAGATFEPPIKGTRGVENYFRVPYGPGWALTGDAAYLRDPSTGLGIGDALAQSFALAEALGTWLDGAEWEPTMKGFHEGRDAAMLPGYRMTYDFTTMPDPPAEDLGVLSALFAMPMIARELAQALPGSLEQLLPPASAARVRALARGFRAAAPAAAP